MATWGEILNELQSLVAAGHNDAADLVRRRALADLHAYTGRNSILYAVGHLQKRQVDPGLVSIVDEDIEGFMEVLHGLEDSALDLILHSPGGSPEATEAIVTYLRSKFCDIRVIVPHQAMSAATMLACAAKQLIMGRQSYLGPIDPQLQLPTNQGIQMIPAQAILDQFDQAKKECVDDQTNLRAWIPMLQQYGPALLKQCENSIALSRELVSDWLATGMFNDQCDREERAAGIADALADHRKLRTHGRPLSADYLRSIGLKIEQLEDDQELQDKVLTVYHAAMHTFSGTPATKVIENHNGSSFIKLAQVEQTLVVAPGQAPPAILPN